MICNLYSILLKRMEEQVNKLKNKINKENIKYY